MLALLLLTVPKVLAQQSKIDSLQQLLTTLPQDTNRVQTLNTLARHYFNIDPEKLKFYTDTALALALKLNHNFSIGSSYTNWAITILLKIIFRRP